MDELQLKTAELALKRSELEIKTFEYLDKSCESSWSSVKFVFGTVFLGLLGAALTFTSFMHTVEKDDVEYLERGKSTYMEPDLEKRRRELEILIAIRKRSEPFLEGQLSVVKQQIMIRDGIRAEMASKAALAKLQADNASAAAIAAEKASAATAAADRALATLRRDQAEAKMEALRQQMREDRIIRKGLN